MSSNRQTLDACGSRPKVQTSTLGPDLGGCCRSPCHVVYTEYRPTPLQHFMYPAGADGLFLVLDERGAFREDSFQKALASLTDQEGTAAAGALRGSWGLGAVRQRP